MILGKNSIISNNSFTLVELLVVIGIISILSAATVLVLNPIELLRESRDAKRSVDIDTIDNTLLYLKSQNDITFDGTANTVYVSVPDSDSGCADLNLPALPGGWSYHCAPTSTLYSADGTGWLPIIIGGQGAFTLPALPVDPTNSTSSCLYYLFAYQSDTHWSIAERPESIKYSSSTNLTDGGTHNELFEKGEDVSVMPSFACGSGGTEATRIDPNKSWVEYYFTSLPADSGTVDTLYIYLADQNGDIITIPNTEFTCSATGSGNSYYFSNDGTYDSNDVDYNYCEISSNQPENKTVSFSGKLPGGNWVTLDQTLDLAFVPPETVGNSSVNYDKTTATADGNDIITMTLTARDVDNNLVGNVITSCQTYPSASSSALTLTGDGQRTDEVNGEMTCTLASTVAQDVTVDIIMGGSMIVGTQTLHFVAP